MEKLFRKAERLVRDGEIIRDNLAGYNPELCKERVPLKVIQSDITSLKKAYSELSKEITKKRRETDE